MHTIGSDGLSVPSGGAQVLSITVQVPESTFSNWTIVVASSTDDGCFVYVEDIPVVDLGQFLVYDDTTQNCSRFLTFRGNRTESQQIFGID